MRYAGRHVIHANRRLRYFPEPDAYGTTVKGRPAPLWKRLDLKERESESVYVEADRP
jgi:hypothetical protein